MNNIIEPAAQEQNLQEETNLELMALLPELTRLINLRKTFEKEHSRTDPSADIFYLSTYEIIECDAAICKLLGIEKSALPTYRV